MPSNLRIVITVWWDIFVVKATKSHQAKLQFYKPVIKEPGCFWPPSLVQALPPPGLAGPCPSGCCLVCVPPITSDAQEWVDLGSSRSCQENSSPSCPVAEGYAVLLDAYKDATVGRVQVLLSATCPKGGALGRYVGGRLDFLKRRSLGQGAVARVISSSVSNPGAALQAPASFLDTRHGGRRSLIFLEAPWNIPLGRRQGYLGPRECVRVCTCMCAWELAHMHMCGREWTWS